MVLVTGATSGLGRAACRAVRRAAGDGDRARPRCRQDEARPQRVGGGDAATTQCTIVVADLDRARRRVNDAAASCSSASTDSTPCCTTPAPCTPTRQTTATASRRRSPSKSSRRSCSPADCSIGCGPPTGARADDVVRRHVHRAAHRCRAWRWTADDYRGTDQYARAKRAQVTLNEMWAALSTVRTWSSTPSTPGGRTLLASRRRSPASAASWGRCSARRPKVPTRSPGWPPTTADRSSGSGGFWHDRRRRPIHRLGRTRRSDTDERREALWSWCVERSGVDPLHTVIAGPPPRIHERGFHQPLRADECRRTPAPPTAERRRRRQWDLRPDRRLRADGSRA